MDRKLFFLIFNFTSENKYLSNSAVFISNFSSKIFIMIYAITSLYTAYFIPDKLVLFLIVPFSLLVLNKILRKIIKRVRPADAFDLSLPVERSLEFSFPSNHATSSMIIALAILFLNLHFGIIMIFMSILTSVSRIMTGLHYPFDVIFGWILALTFGIAFL